MMQQSLPEFTNIRIAALAGGVGGAKLADGLARIVPPENLAVIVNTGDDFDHLGLRICPDLDTVCYTLAGMANPETGWGRRDESWQAFDNLSLLGGPDWFRLGDRDLATHLERTRRLAAGERLTQITRDFCSAWAVRPVVLPMSDDPAPTIVLSDEGELPFQEYFVHRQCRPVVQGFRFEGQAVASFEVLGALADADLVILCPSNPWVSIDPILNLRGITDILVQKRVLAVSPIIGGQAVKGPAAKMYAEMGIRPSAAAVAAHYASFLDVFVMDEVDEAQAGELRGEGLAVLAAPTWMKTPADRVRLAHTVLDFGVRLLSGLEDGPVHEGK